MVVVWPILVISSLLCESKNGAFQRKNFELCLQALDEWNEFLKKYAPVFKEEGCNERTSFKSKQKQ